MTDYKKEIVSHIPAALAAVSLTSASLEAAEDDPAQELDDEDGPK